METRKLPRQSLPADLECIVTSSHPLKLYLSARFRMKFKNRCDIGVANALNKKSRMFDAAGRLRLKLFIPYDMKDHILDTKLREFVFPNKCQYVLPTIFGISSDAAVLAQINRPLRSNLCANR